MQNEVGNLMTMLNEIKGSVDEKTAKKLELEKCERIIDRLSSFSVNCVHCKQEIFKLKEHMTKLKKNIGQIEVEMYKEHKEIVQQVANHLQKKHKLVAEGTFLAIYMSIGLSIGMVFGLTIFDNIALGMPIGMSIGLAIGAGLDADAKKKGRTI